DDTSHSSASPPTCAARASAFAASTSTQATRAPAPASAAQIPSPSPPPAPVTIATRPASENASRPNGEVLHLAHRDGAPVLGGAVRGLDERHRLQVVVARDLGLRSLLDR